MIQKLVTAISLTILVLLTLVSVVYADPIATAQAADRAAQDAQWQVNQSASKARSARATAQAAYQLATVQAVEATATAVWSATATPAAATSAARATSDSLNVLATQQMLSQEATLAANTINAESTQTAGHMAATATQRALWVQLDELDIQRARVQTNIFTYGAWALGLTLLVVVALGIGWLMTLGARAILTPAGPVSEFDFADVIEGEFYTDNGAVSAPRALPAVAGERPAFLRPIAKSESRRQTIGGTK